MEKIRIITDSASDISYEDEKELDIIVLPFQVAVGDDSYTSRIDFDNEGFYRMMEEHPDEIPKTSQITPYEFQEFYLERAQEGCTDIILVLINSKGSSTFGNAVMAKDLFYEEHPEYKEMKIHLFDSRGYCALYGAPVVTAAKMAKEGRSAADIASYLEETLPKRRIYFGMYTLKYAGKSGRIPSAAAFVGDRLNLKPIMKIYDKEITTAAKVRGEGKLIARVADMAVADMAEGSPYEIIYGSDANVRDELETYMLDKVGYGPAGYYQIGAAVAANAGPKVAGISFDIK